MSRGEKCTFLVMKDSCFDYMFKTKFSGRNKTWGALSPHDPPEATGLDRGSGFLLRKTPSLRVSAVALTFTKNI